MSAPPRFPAGRPLSPLAAAKDLESLPPRRAPLLLLRALPFERLQCLACRAGRGLRSGASREGDAFPENQEAFHRFVILFEARGSLPGFFSDSVSASRRRALHQSGLATRSTSAFAFYSFPPRVRLSPDGPSTEERIGRFALSRVETPLSRAGRSALTASTIQQLAG